MTTTAGLCCWDLRVPWLVAPIAALGQSFPSKPIRWIVGVPAGGGLDMQARILSGLMSKSLGQPIVVDNRPGGGGATPPAASQRRPPTVTR